MRTALERARDMWEHEGWIPPQNVHQETLYCLFWTNLMPDDDSPGGSWTRPPRWVERLVRGPDCVVVV